MASDSGSTGPGKAPAWAKASNKKPTVATLAGQLDVVSNSLQVITEQLTQLTLRQDAMEKQVGSQRTDVPAFQPLGSGKSSMNISSLLLVVHLIHQLLSPSCLLSSWWLFTLNTNSFPLLFCFLFLVVVHLKRPTPVFYLSAFFFLVVVHLKHQLLSSAFLLSSPWWWLTLNANSFLLSSVWLWFTLNTHSFLLFCFLLLGGGSP